jgi:hypothetical protein
MSETLQSQIQPYRIPPQLIEGWTSIHDDAPVSLRFTKGDLDALFFAFAHIVRAQSEFQGAVVELSNGRAEAASIQMAESTRWLSTADDNFRRFFTAVMASAVTGGAGA